MRTSLLKWILPFVALIVGVVVGTYSSLFIATPVMYDSVKRGNAMDALKAKEKEEELEA